MRKITFILLFISCFFGFSQELTTEVVITDVISCNGSCDGAMTITATGGISPYEYSIDEGNSYIASNFFSGLCPGEYVITTRDANGDVYNSNVIILNQPEQIELNTSIVEPITNNLGASIEATVTGGTPPYEYIITADSVAEENSFGVFSNLSEGIYLIQVVDAGGCLVEVAVEIEPLVPIEILLSAQDVACNGSADGAINVALQGGTPPFNYQLFDANATNIEVNVSFSSNYIFTGLPAGSYEVFVEDSFGSNSQSTIITLEEPDPISAFYDVINPTCNGEIDGLIVIEANGGTGEYLYAIDGFSSLQESNVFSNLPSGFYEVLVQDSSGCTYVESIVIDEPLLLEASVTNVLPTGNNASGFIEIEATGGLGVLGYEYSIDGISFQSSNVFTGLEAGDYQVIVRDPNDCVFNLPTISIEQIAVDNSITTLTDGVFTANFKDAISYQWINVDTNERIAGATGVDFTPTESGRYQVEMTIDDTTIVSGKGIEKAQAIQTILSPILEFNTTVLDVDDFSTEEFTVYPNPTNGVINVPAYLINKNYVIYNMLGATIDTGVLDNTALNLNVYNQGIYILKVENYNPVRFLKE